MKDILAITAVVIFTIGVVYILFAFLFQSLDFRDWNLLALTVFVCVLISAGFSWIIMLVDKIRGK